MAISAEGQAEARLIEADAEAKALELIAQAVAENPDLISYLYINKINPNVQVMLLPENAPFLLPLPTMGPPAPDEISALPTATPLPSPTPLPEPTPTPE